MTTASDAPDSAEIPAQDDLAVRGFLGPYELKRKLGQGGMGAVYLAVDPQKREQLALKILPREKASNPQLVKRFKAEAQNAAQLTHENIVGVFGTGEDDGYLYIALEFIDGIDVHDLIQKRGVLPVKRSIDIIKQVSRALQHALEQHIVHRDIKPANLLVRRDGVVKLADMGLARAVDESIETGITRAGTTVGTVDYMSPEQARNSKAADVRSDIYSLGCTWYHMLTGRPPFAEGSLTNKLNAHAKQPPPDARDINPNVPEGVVAVMQRMMAKNPDDRYQSPQELIEDLEGTLVNKDAVSRQILEGIMDDLPEPLPAVDSGSSNSHVASHSGRSPTGRSPASTVSPSSHTTEDRDVYAVRSPILSSETSVATESPSIEDTPRPVKSTAAHLKPASTPPAKGSPPHTANSTTSARKTVEVDEPVVVTKPSVGTAKPGNAPKHQADEPVRLIELPTRQAAVPAKGGKPEKVAAQPGPGHTMPPPRRRTNNDEPLVTISSPISPKKLATTIGSIAAILVIVWIAFPWIKKAFITEEPLVVATNPFEGPPAPPAPVTALPADIPQAVDANQPGGQQTVKSVLTERKDLLSNSTPTVGSVRPGNIAGPDGQVPNGSGPNAVEWMDQPVQSFAAPIFNIRKGQAVEVERQYPVLQDAIKKIAKAGGRLVLYHEGPFELAPVEITGGVVIIEAAAGVRPRIRMVKDSENNSPPGIKLKGGSLALDGVDLITDAGSVAPSVDWTWFDVDDGHIYVKRSSLTLSGHRDGSTTAFKLSGRAVDSGKSRFLLDETVVRGDGLQTALFETSALDVVIRNSLVIAGDAGVFTIRHSQKASADAARKLRIVDSTLSTRQRALTLSSIDLATPIATEVALEGSLVSAPEPGAQSVLLRLEDWPQNKSRVGGLGPFKNLTWNAQGSAVLGFSSLVSSSADTSLVVNDANAWRDLWKESGGLTISSSNWPQGVTGSLADTELKIWSPKTLEALQITDADTGHIPGCRVSKLRTSDFSGAESTAQLVKNRPRMPIPFAAKFVQQVDIGKVDLGKLIASKTWDDGTVFNVSGSGTRPCSPILIEGRKIRIKFNQTEGPTLVIAPKPGPKSAEHLAFITVRGGQLDVEQGTFDYETKDSAGIAPWFMHVENAGFSLHSCRIKVPVNASRSKGLIHWTSGNGSSASKSEGDFSAFGEIVDSVLAGNGTLMSLELANMAFVSRNSAYVARQNLFEITTRPGMNSTPSAIDAQNCTYMVAGTQFVVHSPGSETAQLPPVQIFHQDCVFATLPGEAGGKVGPLLMNMVGSASPTAVVAWTEESCGYGPDLKAFYLAGPTLSTGTVAPQVFDEQWIKRWGERAIQHPLTTSDGVLFEKNLTLTTTQIKPENLTLHKSAKARKWSETGGQLGVRPEQLEAPPSPAPARNGPNTKKNGVPNKPKPPGVSF